MKAASRSYYKRFYWLVASAVAVMTAVMAGSLLLGDSVRGSLMDRVDERLGKAQTVVQTGTGFLADTVLRQPLLDGAPGFLLADGFVSANGQLTPVTVWGTDDLRLTPGQAQVNAELARTLAFGTAETDIPASKPLGTVEAATLGASAGKPLGTVVLHLPSTTLVPSNSLFVSQRYATELRLRVTGIQSSADGGNLLLHNEQVRPLNIFISRREMGRALGVEGRVNVILSPRLLSPEAFAAVWKPAYSGITTTDQDTTTVVGTDRVLLPQAVVDSLRPTARYLAYFVNSLSAVESQPTLSATPKDTIPYSFVTATDQLRGDEAVVSDYAARRLGLSVGDSLWMDYYVSRGELKQLLTRSHRFRVKAVVPMSAMQQQAALIAADFPGLSGVKRCTDWDSDLPIDMGRISRADEDYWERYRQTPKALVSLDAVGSDWGGHFGTATKVCTAGDLSRLTPQSLGVSVVQPRQAALHAAQSGTDFGTLFLALGFFIIVAALLLMQNPLSEMLFLRRQEIALYSVMGFSRWQTARRLVGEALPVVLVAAPVGVLAGYAYAALILWLLAGPWSGATHTDGFALHANPLTVVLALGVALAMATAMLCLTVYRSTADGQVDGGGSIAAGKPPRTNSSAVAAAGARERRPQANAPFSKPGKAPTPGLSLHGSLIRASLGYYRSQHRLSFWTLALGVLIVFAVGLNRPDFSHADKKLTGGFLLYAESRIPIQYDLNQPKARRHLHLGNLPDGVAFLQLPRHTEDEASCLNLNRVATPSVVGMDGHAMADFGISLPPWNDGDSTAPIPVAIDEEALTWSMMGRVGDTLTYKASDGSTVRAVVAATYPTGILHGHAVMDRRHFLRLWHDESGSRIVLANQDCDLSPLRDYGLSITTTTERLSHFFEVTDTYLGIFMSLGGLGLLLGLMGLVIVIRKNLAARNSELRLYHALGFAPAAIEGMLRREQLVVPLLAIVAGVAGGLLAWALGRLVVWGVSWRALLSPQSPAAWGTAAVLVVAMISLTWIIINKSINKKTIQQCETL